MRQGVYTAAIRLALPYLAVRLGRRALQNRVEVERWREWLGYGAAFPAGTIWLHAASVGEVEAALPLVRALRERHPQRAIVVTTVTPEGASRVVSGLADADVDHRFLPLDLPGAIQRFLRRMQPAIGLVVETELWPNLYRGCERSGIPLLLISGRLSQRSLRRYRRLQPLVARTLACTTRVLAQDEAALAGFRELGLPVDRLELGGNLKFDRAPPPGYELGPALRADVAPDGRSVWAAVSTREGEESAVLTSHRIVRECHPGAVLLWVPRHRAQFDVAERLSREAGYRTARRSGGVSGPVDILIGDTFGETGAYLKAADVAFVGGSLVPLGGQNVLEPAALGVPAVTGPSTEHFAAATHLLETAGALERVADADALGHAVARLLGDADLRLARGTSARAATESARGPVLRVAELVEQLLASSSTH